MSSLSLFYGEDSKLGQLLRNILDKNTLVISDNKWPGEKRIKKSSTKAISNLKDKVSFAVIYPSTFQDIKKTSEIILKTTRDNGKVLIAVESQKIDLITKISKEILDLPQVSVVVIGEVFGPGFLESNISKIFQKATGMYEIELEFGKETPIAIISQNDLVTILKNHKKNRSEKLLLAMYESPQTLHTAAMQFIKANPDTKIIYDKNPKITEVQQKDIIKKIVLTFGKKPIYATVGKGFEKSVKDISFPQKKELKRKRRKIKKIPLKKSFLFLSSVTVIFLLLSSVFLSASFLNLKNARQSLSAFDIKSSTNSLEKAHEYMSLSSPLVSLISMLPLDTSVKNLLLTGEDTITLAKTTLQEVSNAFKYQNVTNSNQAIAHLTYAFFKLSQNPIPLGNSTSLLGEQTSKIASILQSYPDIVGVNGEKNYLLLFQNNSELRPTGGFIGSVGELKLKKGAIAGITIRDVYELDGQLTAHFEPHFIIRRYLQPHLYLRDSNFSVEFDTASKKAAQIYYSETGKKVDGVIALDFEVVKSLLKHTGEITLPNHNLVLDPTTAQKLIQDTIQEDFFPGSTQKKDILRSLMTKLLLKLESDPHLAASFAKEIPSLISQKHILFSFPDENLQKLFSANNFTGSINDNRQSSDITRNDIFGIVEANIGANKANSSLSKKVKYDVYIGQKSIVSKATLDIFNVSKNSQNYKVYLRFLVPKSSELESISLNETDQKIVPAITDPEIFESKQYTPPDGLEVNEKEMDQYKIIGFTTEVKKNKSQKITVIYTSGIEQNITSQINYSLLYIKQPGTKEYPLSISVKYPSLYSAVTKDFEVTGNKATSSSVATGDQMLILNLKR